MRGLSNRFGEGVGIPRVGAPPPFWPFKVNLGTDRLGFQNFPAPESGQGACALIWSSSKLVPSSLTAAAALICTEFLAI